MSITQLIEPYLLRDFQALPPEARDCVGEDFTENSWNQLSGIGRHLWLRTREEHNDVDRAHFALPLTHGYWFDLQDQIQRTEARIAELTSHAAPDSGNLELASLEEELRTLQSKWYQPDDPIAKRQLTHTKASIGPAPVSVDIPRALRFLSDSTGVTWTETNLFSVASERARDGIWMAASVPPWAKLSLIKWLNNVSPATLPFVSPGSELLAALGPKHVQEVWVTGQTATEHEALPESALLPSSAMLHLQGRFAVSKSDIRIERKVLLTIVRVWNESRQSMAPFQGKDDTALNVPNLAPRFAQDSGQPTAVETAGQAQRTEPEWVAKAREIAKQYIRRHRENDLYPSLKDVSGHVETELRARDIHGAHGRPVSASYIERNALQGDWWQQNKP